MGWAALVLLVAATMIALLLLRVPRLLWSTVGAAMMVATIGYAMQGRPTQAGHPADPDTRMLAADDTLIELRTQMFGRYGTAGAYLTAADAMARSGSARYEVQALLGGIRGDRGNSQLWTALGDALARHDGVRLSPPARFAFDQAIRLDPRHPGPRFFLGIAQVRAQDFAAAEVSWRRALALSAPDAAYRPAIVQRLLLIRQVRRMMGD